jgi:2-polyprenyl-6-methoxyphenol hydroxylase-like FAD-dependent oxidoreductase
MKNDNIPFLIIGGGIGGLTTALGIASTGQPVTVLEKASEFGEIGAGLQLAPNAMAVLDQFGLLDQISEHAVFPKRLLLMDAITEQKLTSLDLGSAFRERYGYPYCVMHRSDLHMVLLNACRDNKKITLLTNNEAKLVENEDKQTRVTCKDGSSYVANYIIGADGLWSNTRKIVSNDDAICSEYVAYRGTIPISEIDSHVGLDDVVMWVGPHLHLVQYPIRRKELFNQVAVFRSSQYKEGATDWGTPEELDEHFSKCSKLVQNAVSYIDRSRHWSMYDREPIDNWISGRVALIGDAAHPMLQYLAQGACQALEDAACLTGKLQEHGHNVDQAFHDYQQQRIPHTSNVQLKARTWGDILHTDDDISVLLRNTIFAKKSPNDFSYVDWLYHPKRIK